MEVKIIASELGASIPKLNIGFRLFSGMYIMLRQTRSAKPYVLGIASGPEIGGNTGTLIAGHVETSWMHADSSRHSWLCDRKALVGKAAEISLRGTLVIKGKVDVSIIICDDASESKHSISKVDVEAAGGQLSDIKIRGDIKDMMSETHQGVSLCARS